MEKFPNMFPMVNIELHPVSYRLGVCPQHGSFVLEARELGRPCPRCEADNHRPKLQEVEPQRWFYRGKEWVEDTAAFRLREANNRECVRIRADALLAINDAIALAESPWFAAHVRTEAHP